MFKFLQSKKGFTIVELMIVLVLMGLGAFALINIFKVAYRSYNKTEERYIKQEMVKTVAEYLQKKASLSSASNVELYDKVEVVPAEGEKNGYNYLYVDPNDGLLYIKAANETSATQLSTEKLYIKFDLIPFEEIDVHDNIVEDINKSRGIKCFIGAVDDSFDYDNPSPDDIFYSLDVSYHFANMVEANALYVNRCQVSKYQESSGYKHSSTTVNNIKYESADNDACVVKFISDISASGDSLLTDANVNMFCFIATASYGVNNGDGTVGLLCDFRDNCLLTNAPGRLFVKTYYAISPPIADFIAQHETLRATVRTMLKPLVVVAEYSLNPELGSEVAPVLLLAFGLGLPLSATAVALNKKRKRDED